MALPRFSLYLFLLIGFMSCAGSGPSRAYTKVANEAVKSTLTPNDPNLPYPIYATLEEMEALFNQNAFHGVYSDFSADFGMAKEGTTP